MQERLTKREKEVLLHLMSNGRISDQEVARRLRTSRPTVYYIRKRLESKKIIKRYTTHVDFDRIGLGIQAVILYRWKDYSKSEELQHIINFIKALPEVIAFIKGEGVGSKTDLIISFHKDLRGYEDFIRKLKYEWRDYVENVEVFLSSVESIFKDYDLSSPAIAKIEEKIIYSK